MNQKEKIVEILQEYPSHPPMTGSELGINMITVDKILEVVGDDQEIKDTLHYIKEDVAEILSEIKK